MDKTVIATPDAPAAIGPYSQGIAGNGLVFVSGQLPVDPKTGAMPETIEAQARQSLTNLKAIILSSLLNVSSTGTPFFSNPLIF